MNNIEIPLYYELYIPYGYDFNAENSVEKCKMIPVYAFEIKKLMQDFSKFSEEKDLKNINEYLNNQTVDKLKNLEGVDSTNWHTQETFLKFFQKSNKNYETF